MGSDTSIRLPSGPVEDHRIRAEATNVDGVEPYLQYVRRRVLHQEDDIDASDPVDEAEVKERLETLGWLE